MEPNGPRMSVLVTGGAGYIGGATVEALLEAGERVVVLDNLSRGHANTIPPGTPFYRGDVGDRSLVARAVEEQQVRACIHFAAYAYVGESATHPDLYLQNNLAQGIALLEALRGAGVREIVFSSSCTVYGEPRYTPIDEDHPQQPTNLYGWTKLLFEKALQSYAQAYGLRYVALRYFNAAGATARHGERHDPEPHLIPNVLRAVSGEIPALQVYGKDYPTHDGAAVRDYIHIADLASAHLLALGHLRNGGGSEAFNLGNGRGYSVLEVIESVKRVTGHQPPFQIVAARPGDPSHLVAQADKAKRILGWEPRIPELDQIVRSAWQWRNRRQWDTHV
jgi:UDP-glucose 4-epimerase